MTSASTSQLWARTATTTKGVVHTLISTIQQVVTAENTTETIHATITIATTTTTAIVANTKALTLDPMITTTIHKEVTVGQISMYIKTPMITEMDGTTTAATTRVLI